MGLEHSFTTWLIAYRQSLQVSHLPTSRCGHSCASTCLRLTLDLPTPPRLLTPRYALAHQVKRSGHALDLQRSRLLLLDCFYCWLALRTQPRAEAPACIVSEGVQSASAHALPVADCAPHALEWQVLGNLNGQAVPPLQALQPHNDATSWAVESRLEQELSESRDEIARLEEHLLRKHDEVCLSSQSFCIPGMRVGLPKTHKLA